LGVQGGGFGAGGCAGFAQGLFEAGFQFVKELLNVILFFSCEVRYYFILVYFSLNATFVLSALASKAFFCLSKCFYSLLNLATDNLELSELISSLSSGFQLHLMKLLQLLYF
jgi:hypothetical protein